MSYINKYLRNFKPYKVASHKIWTVKPEERKNILKLDWNESTLPPTPLVADRLNKAMEEGDLFHLYPATSNEELIQLLSRYIELPKENVQYFGSSDSLHEYISKMYITIGDPVLILGPSYDNFRLTAEVNGAKVFYSYLSDDFVFSEELFERDLNKIHPSLVYICNPNNPTGTLLSVAYIEALLQKYSDIVFLIDEAYSEFSGLSAKELVLKYENLLISRTMSKAFAIANFRFGYLIASEKNVNYISSIRNPKNITTFAQEAAIAVLSDIPYMEQYVTEVREAKALFLEGLRPYNRYFRIFDGAANFVLIRCNCLETKQKLMRFLESKNIFVRNLTHAESLEACLRVTIGTRIQMERVLNEICEFVKVNNENCHF